MKQRGTIRSYLQRISAKLDRMRLYSFLVLFALGLFLVIFSNLRTRGVSNNSGDAAAAESNSDAALSEADLIKLMSVGGVTRSETGEVQKTYKEGEKPDQACPT